MRHIRCANGIGLFSTALGLWLCSALAQAQPNFTKAQAGEGRTAYGKYCASCHGKQLEGVHLSPSLVGARFDQMWRGRTADILSFHLHRMPPESAPLPAKLTDADYANIFAYLLASNGFQPGDASLPSDTESLKKITIPRKEGALIDFLEPGTPSPEQAQRLEKLSPVTEGVRENPPANDWLQWGRTNDGIGFSSLDKITKQNVAGLALAWRRPLMPGTSMPSPLVHDGIMFLHTFPDTLVALDATNGTILWRYRRGSFGDQRIGIALYEDKVIVPTSDMHVVALDAKTGKLVWEHKIDAQGRGFRLRSAPLVVRDKVIQGVTASFAPGGGFILGIDAKTGKEAWRFWTIARPGAPGGNTWNDLPVEKRSGGSVWHQGTYDAKLNLVYFGIAPTYDTGPLLHSLGKEGVTNDALFTNCTVALNPDTGNLVWQYQHVPNDQWDLDWAFERQLADIPFQGKMRRVVMNAGKIAVLDVLDAATGEYLFSVDSGVQNIISAIDPKTGKKTIDPDKMPSMERPCLICPSAHGARSWPPTSYSPRTKMVYLPLTELCMVLGQEGFKLLSSGVGITFAAHPKEKDGMMGRLQAIDLTNGKLGWQHELQTPLCSSVLSTAGGLVFVGDLEPSLKAFDDETGAQVWRVPLDDNPSSSIITYAVDDTQYVAVVAGASNLHLSGITDGYKQFGSGEGKSSTGGIKGGTAVWAFALK